MPKPKAVSQKPAPKSASAKQAPARQNQKLSDPNLRELNRTLAAAHSHINMSLSTPGPEYPYEGLQSSSASSSLLSASAIATPSDRTWNEYPLDPNERWVVTNVNGGDRPGVLKFTLGYVLFRVGLIFFCSISSLALKMLRYFLIHHFFPLHVVITVISFQMKTVFSSCLLN